MTEIRILKTDAVRKLEDEFSNYRKDPAKLQRLMDQQSVSGAMSFEVPELDSNSDFESAKRLYAALKNLTTVMASDERLWIYLFHTVFNEYRIERLKVQYPKGAPEDSKIMSNTLFTGNRNDKIRSKFLNYLSRLWWAGYFTDGSDKALHLLTDIDFSGLMTSYFSSTLTSVDAIRKGTFKAVIDFRELLNSDNEDIKIVIKKIDKNYFGNGVRNLLIESNRYLNTVSSAVVLDIYSEEEISDMVLTHLMKHYDI